MWRTLDGSKEIGYKTGMAADLKCIPVHFGAMRVLYPYSVNLTLVRRREKHHKVKKNTAFLEEHFASETYVVQFICILAIKSVCLPKPFETIPGINKKIWS